MELIYTLITSKFTQITHLFSILIQGVGKTSPDPADFTELDGSKVPFGAGVKAADVDSALLYNEYIVYDVAQVQSKYLFKMRFDYNV